MSRCNFDGWSDVIGEVPWCLSMQTTVRHEAELESDPLWHVQPVQFVVQLCRQTTVKHEMVEGSIYILLLGQTTSSFVRVIRPLT